MKTLLVAALLSSLVPPALSLTCYVCTSAVTNDACNNNNVTQECRAPLDICMTVVDILGNSKFISKLCASEATCLGSASSASVDSNGDGNIVNCCNTFDLCNFSGAECVHTHTALLLLTAGVLLLLSR
ncbi:urokinase plasminogen activator surface receptor-like [Clinocottus analis]|uniref:urokinase plasminogen activator surface receptor-like n=1 Tax=Clinocottus analis TaxID=304258 RepID=UPI0035C1DA97